MPPKPPIRIPLKPPQAVKAGNTPFAKASPRSTPKPSSQTSTPPSQPWYSHPSLRGSARTLTFSANIVVGFCGLIWLRDHFVKVDRVRGSSMAPTLSPDAHETGRVDWVVLRPYMERAQPKQRTEDNDGTAPAEPGGRYGVKRGDVVTFWKPHKPEEMGIKRVVALEGDTVYPVRGYALDPAVRVNRVQGLPDGLPDVDPDAIQAQGEGGAEILGKVVVPHGHVWVEGDNWRKSYDSNDFGPISKGLIEGKAMWIWRRWWEVKEVGDERKKGEGKWRSRVVQGRSVIPAAYLE